MHFFSKEAFNFKEQVRNLGKIQNIAVCGLFIALYVVLSYLNIKITDSIEIRFAFMVLAIAGFYGGPVMGLTVGVASDLLSMLMTAGKGSPFFFGFTFDYALIGFLFGIILYKAKITVPRIIAAEFAHYLVAVTLHTYWLHVMYGSPLSVIGISRLIKCSIMFPIEVIILYIIMKAFSQIAVHAGILQKA